MTRLRRTLVAWPALVAALVVHRSLGDVAAATVVLGLVGLLPRGADIAATAAFSLAGTGLVFGLAVAAYEALAARTWRRAWVWWLGGPALHAAVFALAAFARTPLARAFLVSAASALGLLALARRQGAAMAGQNPERGAHDLK